MRLSLSPVAAFIFLVVALPIEAAEPAYRVVSQEVLAGDVKWDYLTFDASSARLFITHGDQVDVYDTKRNQVVGSIVKARDCCAPDIPFNV